MNKIDILIIIANIIASIASISTGHLIIGTAQLCLAAIFWLDKIN